MDSVSIKSLRNRLLQFKNYDLFNKWIFSLNGSTEIKYYQTKELIKYDCVKFALTNIISNLVLDVNKVSDRILCEINVDLYQLKIELVNSSDLECANKVYSFYGKYWPYAGINDYFAKTNILFIADCLLEK